MCATGKRGTAVKDENTCRCKGRRRSDACGEEDAGGSEQRFSDRRTVGTFRISSVSKVRASTTCSSDVCWNRNRKLNFRVKTEQFAPE